jgi:C4-dicarboxylate-specific signal transduction histidine kinase
MIEQREPQRHVAQFAVVDYYFTPPFGSLRLGAAELPRLAIFVMVAAFIATMSAARRTAEKSLKTVRAGLETRVRERTDELQQTNERLTGAVAAAVAAQQRFQGLVNTVEGIVSPVTLLAIA